MDKANRCVAGCDTSKGGLEAAGDAVEEATAPEPGSAAWKADRLHALKRSEEVIKGKIRGTRCNLLLTEPRPEAGHEHWRSATRKPKYPDRTRGAPRRKIGGQGSAPTVERPGVPGRRAIPGRQYKAGEVIEQKEKDPWPSTHNSNEKTAAVLAGQVQRFSR